MTPSTMNSSTPVVENIRVVLDVGNHERSAAYLFYLAVKLHQAVADFIRVIEIGQKHGIRIHNKALCPDFVYCVADYLPYCVELVYLGLYHNQLFSL